MRKKNVLGGALDPLGCDGLEGQMRRSTERGEKENRREECWRGLRRMERGHSCSTLTEAGEEKDVATATRDQKLVQVAGAYL